MPRLINQAGVVLTTSSSVDSDDSSEDEALDNSSQSFKDHVIRFLEEKISNRNMLLIRDELLKLKQTGTYFKLTRTAPMAAGLMNDMFCNFFIEMVSMKKPKREKP